MSGVNKAIIFGKVVHEPKVFDDRNLMIMLTVLTSEKYEKDGESRETKEFHNVNVYGKIAEKVKERLAKDQWVYVEGRLATRKYDDKDGVERKTTNIIASNVQILCQDNAMPPKIQRDLFESQKSKDNVVFMGDDDVPF